MVVVVVVMVEELGLVVVLVVKVSKLAAIVKDKQTVVLHVDNVLKAATTKLDAWIAIQNDVQDKESILQYDLEQLGPSVSKLINDTKAKLKEGKGAKAGLMIPSFDACVSVRALAAVVSGGVVVGWLVGWVGRCGWVVGG